MWLSSEGHSRYGSSSVFQSIVELHHKVHALAEELLALSAECGKAMALSRLGELFTLRDTLLNQLSQLLREVSS